VTRPSAQPRQDSPVTAPAGAGASVASSVLAATEALDHLERSLRAGGFVEGTSAYERMAEVLLAQRLWHGSSDPRLADDFQRLGETARRIFGMLHPYTVVMRRLATLAPAGAEADHAADDGEAARVAVLTELNRRGRRGASMTVLTRATGLAAAVVEAVLRPLIDDGEVTERGIRTARSFSMADPAPGRAAPSRAAPSRAARGRRQPVRPARREEGR